MRIYIYVFLCGFMANACLYRIDAGKDVFIQVATLSALLILVVIVALQPNIKSKREGISSE